MWDKLPGWSVQRTPKPPLKFTRFGERSQVADRKVKCLLVTFRRPSTTHRPGSRNSRPCLVLALMIPLSVCLPLRRECCLEALTPKMMSKALERLGCWRVPAALSSLDPGEMKVVKEGESWMF